MPARVVSNAGVEDILTSLERQMTRSVREQEAWYDYMLSPRSEGQGWSPRTPSPASLSPPASPSPAAAATTTIQGGRSPPPQSSSSSSSSSSTSEQPLWDRLVTLLEDASDTSASVTPPPSPVGSRRRRGRDFVRSVQLEALGLRYLARWRRYVTTQADAKPISVQVFHAWARVAADLRQRTLSREHALRTTAQRRRRRSVFAAWAQVNGATQTARAGARRRALLTWRAAVRLQRAAAQVRRRRDAATCRRCLGSWRRGTGATRYARGRRAFRALTVWRLHAHLQAAGRTATSAALHLALRRGFRAWSVVLTRRRFLWLSFLLRTWSRRARRRHLKRTLTAWRRGLVGLRADVRKSRALAAHALRRWRLRTRTMAAWNEDMTAATFALRRWRRRAAWRRRVRDAAAGAAQRYVAAMWSRWRTFVARRRQVRVSAARVAGARPMWCARHHLRQWRRIMQTRWTCDRARLRILKRRYAAVLRAWHAYSARRAAVRAVAWDVANARVRRRAARAFRCWLVGATARGAARRRVAKRAWQQWSRLYEGRKSARRLVLLLGQFRQRTCGEALAQWRRFATEAAAAALWMQQQCDEEERRREKEAAEAAAAAPTPSEVLSRAVLLVLPHRRLRLLTLALRRWRRRAAALTALHHGLHALHRHMRTRQERRRGIACTQAKFSALNRGLAALRANLTAATAREQLKRLRARQAIERWRHGFVGRRRREQAAARRVRHTAALSRGSLALRVWKRQFVLSQKYHALSTSLTVRRASRVLSRWHAVASALRRRRHFRGGWRAQVSRREASAKSAMFARWVAVVGPHARVAATKRARRWHRSLVVKETLTRLRRHATFRIHKREATLRRVLRQWRDAAQASALDMIARAHWARRRWPLRHAVTLWAERALILRRKRRYAEAGKKRTPLQMAGAVARAEPTRLWRANARARAMLQWRTFAVRRSATRLRIRASDCAAQRGALRRALRRWQGRAHRRETLRQAALRVRESQTRRRAGQTLDMWRHVFACRVETEDQIQRARRYYEREVSWKLFKAWAESTRAAIGLRVATVFSLLRTLRQHFRAWDSFARRARLRAQALQRREALDECLQQWRRWAREQLGKRAQDCQYRFFTQWRMKAAGQRLRKDMTRPFVAA